MRIIIILIILTGAMLYFGAQGLYVYLTNLEPETISIDEFDTALQHSKWLRLTEGYLDITDCVYFYKGEENNIDEVFIPVKSVVELYAEEDVESPIKVLAATKKQEVIDLLKEWESIPGEDEALNYFIDHYDKFIRIMDVEGLVRFGMDETDSSDKDEIERLHENLAENYLVINWEKKPNVVQSLIFLGVGLALLAVIIGIFFKERTKRPRKQPPTVKEPEEHIFRPGE